LLILGEFFPKIFKKELCAIDSLLGLFAPKELFKLPKLGNDFFTGLLIPKS